MLEPIKGGGEVGHVKEGGEGVRVCFWPACEASSTEAEGRGVAGLKGSGSSGSPRHN